MTAILIFILFVLVLAVWAILHGRISELTARIDELGRQRPPDRVTPAVVLPAPPGFAPLPDPFIPPPPTPEPFLPPTPPFVPPRPRFVPPPIPAVVESPAFAAATPSHSERLRRVMGSDEWETLLAGSILNKIGALVLVVGIALLLGYSFARIGPAGRASIAAVSSLLLLGAGVLMERRNNYQVFSRGLIGAGWAALYTTAYAMYALPAAQVIPNAFAGSALLLAVAAGMIAHSLRYRAQAITSVAYFTAFAALAVTPSTPFALASLVPLAASLLYFAWRFRWHAMALFGLFATYGACISRGSSNASLYATESLLIVYWLLFEIFDILRARRRSTEVGVGWIFPLNAIAFLGLSYHTWMAHAPQWMWRMAAVSAALYLMSAVARLPLTPAASRATNREPFDSIREGTYEAPLTLSAVLAGLAILGRVSGLWTNAWLAAEAELLYLAGVRFRSQFLRVLGGLGFFASIGNLVLIDSSETAKTSLWGLQVYNWTPSVLFDAFLFYLNRMLWRPNRLFSFAGSALVALVLAAEAKPHFAGVYLFAFAIVLFELGIRKQLPEFRTQAYLVAAAGVVATLLQHGFTSYPAASVWFSCGMVTLACWYIAARILLAADDAISIQGSSRVLDSFALVGAFFALLTLWMVVPGAPTPLAWTGLALLYIQLGFELKVASLQLIGSVVLVAAYVRLLGINLYESAQTEGHPERLLIGLVVLAALYYAWHLFARLPEGNPQRALARIHTWLAAILALRLIDLESSSLFVVSGWAALALVFLIIGVWQRLIDFRYQSYAITLLVVLRCVSINFAASEAASMAERIFAVSICIAIFFIAEALTPRSAGIFTDKECHARTLFSLAATFLLTSLLFHEVSGSLLTLAWGLEGLSLLGVGIAARERALRLEGLGILMLCILKLFIYDLRNLEIVPRILTFIGLGVILLGVSWIYTRFRVQVRRYL